MDHKKFTAAVMSIVTAASSLSFCATSAIAADDTTEQQFCAPICFCGCDRLEYIVLPESIKALPESCFRACFSLENLILPDELESIGEFCFSDCESMNDISIGENIRSIGNGAFFMCHKLNSIHIPSTCKIIGAQALGYDSNGNELVRNEKFLITGEIGSVAQIYALENIKNHFYRGGFLCHIHLETVRTAVDVEGNMEVLEVVGRE